MLFITQGPEGKQASYGVNKTNWKFLLIVFILATIVGGGVLGYLIHFEKEIVSISQFPGIKGLSKIESEKLKKVSEEEAIELVKKFPEVKEWLSTFTEQCEIFTGRPCKIEKTVEGTDSGIRCTPEIKIDHIHIKGEYYIVHTYEVCKSKDGKWDYISELGENKGWYKVHMGTGEVTLKRPLEEEIEGWKIYRNEKYGFEFKYPKEYDECELCKIKEINKGIEMGEGRFSIEIIGSEGLSLVDYVSKFVNEHNLEIPLQNISVSVGGNEGFKVDLPGSRPASYIFLFKDNKIYQISWGAWGVTGCLGYAQERAPGYEECRGDYNEAPSELEVFEQIPYTFRFIE